MGQVFGRDSPGLAVAHRYACEKKKAKRAFLRRMWPEVPIFKDVSDLTRLEAIALFMDKLRIKIATTTTTTKL